MNSESIKKVTNQAIEQLMEALKAGHSEALTSYLAVMGKFRTYSFLNVLLILKQRPSAGRVAGYKTWQSFGRHVKQGEKGIMILAPMFGKAVSGSEESNESNSTNDSRKVFRYRAVYVWAEEQTAGKDLPEIGHITGDPSFYLERLETFVRASGITLTYSEDIAPAKGTAEKGKITLLPDQTSAETFATLVHEQAHAMLHQSPRRATKRIRETEAEAVAYVVCTAIGLQPGSACADYVGLYGGDAKLLLDSLQHVQETASRILDAMEMSSERQAA
jgi:antirestriction protein ArdC